MNVPPPLASVVMVCYNGRSYIGEALASVEAQTHRPLEVLVVDDGSTDGTPDLVAGRRWKIPVRLIRFPRNRGPAQARRRGVRAARGPWIAFLDADDVWRPHKLEKQMAAAAAGVRFIYSDVDVVDRDGRLLKRRALAGSYITLYGEYFRSRGWPLPFYPLTSTVVARRDLILSLGSFDAGFRYICDDADMWFRCLKRLGERGVRCLPEALAKRRKHGSQIHVPVPGRPRWEVATGVHSLVARRGKLDPVEREKLLDMLYINSIKHRHILLSVGASPE